MLRAVQLVLERVWGDPAWPTGPWRAISITAGNRSCLLEVDGGVVEVDLASGQILGTEPDVWRTQSPPVIEFSADRGTTVARVGPSVEVRRSGDAGTLVLPPGSTVWPSPDGSWLLVLAPWDATRNRAGAVTWMRWRDRAILHSSETGGGASLVAWLGDRVAFVDRNQLLHCWASDGRVTRVSLPGAASALVPVVLDGETLLLAATRSGRTARTELRSSIDGSLVRVLSETASLTGAATTDGRLVTVHGQILSLATGEVLREFPQATQTGRIVLSPRGDRAVVGRGDRIDLVDLERWEVIRSIDEARGAGYSFSGSFLPDGQHVVLVTDGLVRFLDARGQQKWTFAMTRDLAWDGVWELPSWASTHARVHCDTDALYVAMEWIRRGPVQGDGHQDYEGNLRLVVLGLDGAPVDRPPPADLPPPELAASIERLGTPWELVVLRRGDDVAHVLDIALAHGPPSSAAITSEPSARAQRFCVGTKRGLLLCYRIEQALL